MGRGVNRVCRWSPAAIAPEYQAHRDGQPLVSHLESELGRDARVALEKRLQRVLNEYHPECGRCGVLMYRDHTYLRSFMTRHGEVQLNVTVLGCAECELKASGMDVLGQETGRASAAQRR